LEEEVCRKESLANRKPDRKKLQKDNNKMSASTHFNSIQNSAGKNKKRAEKKLESFQERERPIFKRPLKIDFSEMKKSGNKVLEVKNLVLPFGSQKEISLEVFAGDRVLISGKNGAGKTTLIKTLLKSYTEKFSDTSIK
jgi:ATPase subunit of ABC transporter with duplicated ATPase domains